MSVHLTLCFEVFFRKKKYQHNSSYPHDGTLLRKANLHTGCVSWRPAAGVCGVLVVEEVLVATTVGALAEDV